jgi:hypothetical protein
MPISSSKDMIKALNDKNIKVIEGFSVFNKSDLIAFENFESFLEVASIY